MPEKTAHLPALSLSNSDARKNLLPKRGEVKKKLYEKLYDETTKATIPTVISGLRILAMRADLMGFTFIASNCTSRNEQLVCHLFKGQPTTNLPRF
jgi:hypothetical protein